MCLTHGEPDRNGSHSYPWLMAAHLAAGRAADSSEEFEKYLLDLQPHVRTCLSLSPSTTFSMDIETCYPVDTVHNSPIDDYKQGMKELAAKFDAQTIRTVAKLHDQFGHPSGTNLDSSVWPQSLVHSSSIMWLIQISTSSSGKGRNVAFKRSWMSSHDLRLSSYQTRDSAM